MEIVTQAFTVFMVISVGFSTLLCLAAVFARANIRTPEEQAAEDQEQMEYLVNRK